MLSFLRALKGQTLHCLGDSHLRYFKAAASKRWWRTNFRFCIVAGASCMGLANPRSQTNAFETYQAYLKNLKPADPLLFCLGEVDCGFVIWWQAEQKGMDVETQFAKSLASYRSFLESVRKQGFKRIIVSALPLPTIRDEEASSQVAPKRRDIRAGIRERHELTRRYNDAMKEWCRTEGFDFLDFHADVLDEKGGLKNAFYPKDSANHHMNSRQMGNLLAAKLKRAGFF